MTGVLNNLSNIGSFLNPYNYINQSYIPAQKDDTEDYAILLLTSHGGMMKPQPESVENPILIYDTAKQNRYDNVNKINAVKCGIVNMLSFDTVDKIVNLLKTIMNEGSYSLQEASSFLPNFLSAIDLGKDVEGLLGSQSVEGQELECQRQCQLQCQGQNRYSKANINTEDMSQDYERKKYDDSVSRDGKYGLFRIKKGEDFYDKFITINDGEKSSYYPYYDEFVLFSKKYSSDRRYVEPILLYADVMKYVDSLGYRIENNYSIPLSHLLGYIKSQYNEINNLIVIDLTCSSGLDDRTARYITRGDQGYGGGNKKNRKTKRKNTKRKNTKRKNTKRKNTKRKNIKRKNTKR